MGKSFWAKVTLGVTFVCLVFAPHSVTQGVVDCSSCSWGCQEHYFWFTSTYFEYDQPDGQYAWLYTVGGVGDKVFPPGDVVNYWPLNSGDVWCDSCPAPPGGATPVYELYQQGARLGPMGQGPRSVCEPPTVPPSV